LRVADPAKEWALQGIEEPPEDFSAPASGGFFAELNRNRESLRCIEGSILFPDS